MVRTGEEACVSAEIHDAAVQAARTSKICLDCHQKSDFELNFNLHLRHSCNQNIQNIVTWGQNTSTNIERFACISMGGRGVGHALATFEFLPNFSLGLHRVLTIPLFKI